VYVHIVFSTKERKPFLKGLDVRGELHAYLGGVSNNLGCAPLIVGGVEDHVHILARQARTITLAD
jgi:REP element-mobilizing transposase RayT